MNTPASFLVLHVLHVRCEKPVDVWHILHCRIEKITHTHFLNLQCKICNTSKGLSRLTCKTCKTLNVLCFSCQTWRHICQNKKWYPLRLPWVSQNIFHMNFSNCYQGQNATMSSWSNARCEGFCICGDVCDWLMLACTYIWKPQCSRMGWLLCAMSFVAARRPWYSHGRISVMMLKPCPGGDQRGFCAENKMRKSVSEPFLHFSWFLSLWFCAFLCPLLQPSTICQSWFLMQRWSIAWCIIIFLVRY